MARLVTMLLLCVTVLAPRAANAEPQVSDVDRQITELSARLEALVEQHNALRSDLAATRSRADATNQRIANLNRNIDAARERLNRIAVWAYQNGPTAGIGSVLAAGSPDSFMTRLSTVEDLARTDEHQIRGLMDSARTLAADNASLQRLLAAQVSQEAELGALSTQVEKDIATLNVLRTQIGAASRLGSSTSNKSAQFAGWPVRAVSGAAGTAVSFAYAQIGKPYQWGADGPGSYDCSGLTGAAWQAAGFSLPHNAARQYAAVAHLRRAQLQPGDLVFYYRDIHHVAMYVGNNAVVHAPNSGERVRVEQMDFAPIAGFGRPA
jgi:cell wall-associated NlpC family hydrolase